MIYIYIHIYSTCVCVCECLIISSFSWKSLLHCRRSKPGSKPLVTFVEAMSSFTSMTEINHECLTVEIASCCIQRWVNNLYIFITDGYPMHKNIIGLESGCYARYALCRVQIQAEMSISHMAMGNPCGLAMELQSWENHRTEYPLVN